MLFDPLSAYVYQKEAPEVILSPVLHCGFCILFPSDWMLKLLTEGVTLLF